MRMRFLLPVAFTFVLLFGLVGCDSGGDVPNDIGNNTSVSFAESEAVIGEEGESYTVGLTINDAGFKDVPVSVSFNASQSSATRGEDLEVPSDTTIRFPESTTSGDSKSFTIGVIDDDEFLEGDETAVFDLGIADSVEAMAGETAQFTLTIEENDETVTTQGARDLETGSRAIVEGIVTRIDGSDGVYLQDDVGALFVFDGDVVGEVSQGDEVRVDGSTAFFSGLFQLTDVGAEGVTVLSSGNDLPDPQTITLSDLANGGGEQFESQLVRVQDFSINDGGDQAFQGDTGYDIQNSSGSSTLFVPAGSELVGEDIPDRATFQGVLNQFNGGFVGADEPDEGYQLLGLLSSDLEALATLPDFEIFANAQDLEPSSGNTDAHCLIQRSTGEVVFFNGSDGGIFSYDNALNVERSSADLNSDISAESNTINRCDGVAKDASDNVYFLFRADESSSTNSWPTFVYKLPASGSPSVLASEDGLQGVTHDAGTVYLTGVSFRGAPGDGFFSVNDTDEGQSVSEVVTEGALDLNYGIDVDANGNLYAFSGGFADAPRVRKIVRVTDPSGSATLEEFVDPYRDGSPLITGSGDDIADVDFVTQNGEGFLVVYNGSFEAENGDQWASIRISDQSIDLLFNRSQLVANSSADGYTSGFTEPAAVNAAGEIFVASRAAFGADDYIAKVSEALP